MDFSMRELRASLKLPRVRVHSRVRLIEEYEGFKADTEGRVEDILYIDGGNNAMACVSFKLGDSNGISVWARPIWVTLNKLELN